MMRATRNTLVSSMIAHRIAFVAFAAIGLAPLAMGALACNSSSSSAGGNEQATSATASGSGSARPSEIPVGSEPVLIAPLACGGYLGADADAVYVTEVGKNDIVVRVAKKDGAITRLDAAGARVTSVVTDSKYVYVATTSAIKRAKIGANGEEGTLQPFIAKAEPEMLAIDGPNLYWVDKTLGLFKTITEGAPAPKKVFTAEGGYHIVITPDAYFMDGVEIEEKSKQQRAFVWTIPRVASDADAPKKIPIGASPGFFSMTVDLADRSIYAVGGRTTGNAVKKELYRVGPDGMSRRLFARTPTFVSARGGTLFFSDCATKGGSRIEEFVGGKRSLVTKLPDDECAAAFAVDGDALYVPGVRGVSKISIAPH